MADPLEGVETGPVFWATPAHVAVRPLDPRQGNEWKDLGTVTSMKISRCDGADPQIPVVTVPYDELIRE